MGDNNKHVLPIDVGTAAASSHSGAPDPAARPNGNPIMEFWRSILTKDEPADIIVTPESYAAAGPIASIAAMADNYFRISDRGSSFYLETIGGITTFFSMCYILVLNGIIIGGPFNTGISVNGAFFATALAAGIFTSLMGLFVGIPIALAPGMGLNGYFATIAPACYPDNATGEYSGVHCPGWGETSLPWTDAMGAVFISGWFYIAITVTGLRSMLFRAIPPSLRASIVVGIGFFITIIGIKIGALIRVDVASWAIPIAYDAAGCSSGTSGISCESSTDLNFSWYELGMVKFNEHPPARIAVLGLVFVSALEMMRVKGAIIISIVLATLIGINYWRCDSTDPDLDSTKCVTDVSKWAVKGGPTFIVDVTDIPSGKLSFHYADKPFFWDCVFSFLFVELFDSFGTITGIMIRAGLMKGDQDKAMARVNRAMCVDGCGLALGAIIGSNSITCFVESNTGIEAGARTGFASVVTGGLFLLSLLFVAPFVAIIPDAATTCALVMVGVHSLSDVREINFNDFADALPAFFTIAIMGFTYSIANGITAGFIFFTWLRTVRYCQLHISKFFGKEAEYGPAAGLDTTLPHPLMYIMALYSVLRLALLNG